MGAGLTKTRWLLLNATADDFEDLEQLYRSVCLEFSAEQYDPTDPNSFYWREAEGRVPLSEVVENLRCLVDQGMLSVKLPDRDDQPDTVHDLSYLWKGWFRITSKGKGILMSSEPRSA